jgi:D-alanine transaminase
MPLPVVWLDGRLLPLEDARISPLDRGFLFGDGAYEVVPVYGGRAYRFDAHMDRLDRSLAEIRMAPPLPREEWRAIFGKLVHGNGGGDLLLYVQVTRGVEAERFHVPQPATRPTVFACVQALPRVPAVAIEKGVAAVSAEDIRWSRCDIKSTSLLGNVLMRWLAADAGAAETILLRGGQMTEASASSAHLVVGGRIVTPPQTNAILPGTTRGVIFELAAREGIASERRPVAEAEMRVAEELLIASAGGGIRAVTTLDGKAVGGGTPGPVYRRLYSAFMATRHEFSTELPA